MIVWDTDGLTLGACLIIAGFLHCTHEFIPLWVSSETVSEIFLVETSVETHIVYCMSASLLLITISPLAALLSPIHEVRVCTSTACKKAGSRDTLETLHYLAATSEQAADTAERSGGSLATAQAMYGSSRVDSCGCLGGCGKGPNCMTTADESDIFYDVYKPKSAAALLEHVGLSIPLSATRVRIASSTEF